MLLTAGSVVALLCYAVAFAHVPQPSAAHHGTYFGAPWAGDDGHAARGSWPFEPGHGPPAPPPGRTNESSPGDGEGAHAGPPDGSGDFGCPVDPSVGNLRVAFRRTLAHWLSRERRKYGHLYYDLHKSYTITSVNVGPMFGTVTISYEGSVKERGSGKTITASGGASAGYKWVGCRWVNTDISY